ncbi:FAD/NAD-P-binding domain-containing protein [Mycena indigotica]|uniref:FAD/NAD-P-binding domain-containing protein n=1 Tax=Mycena indigotica TaxID=2126181 RepID=A0A8H6S4S3_9AGAR|nr:FAD/NAD-P-binding domain-containing protein [Mycena indigotica]KAF7292753.1 FAD/NAD-P-binding domain-containing protein [Mycena indigotica]
MAASVPTVEWPTDPQRPTVTVGPSKLALPIHHIPNFIPLHFIIVGCGLGGLAAAYSLGRAGHRVTVFEGAAKLVEVGAGIQISPNVSRLLIRWGLGEELRAAMVKPQAITFRRYKTGRRVGWTKWGTTMDNDYGAPYCHLHRADLLNMLYKLAAPYMTLFLNSRVVKVDADRCCVSLASGASFSADIILGADGVKSMVREVVVGRPDKPIPTGDAAYRAIIPTSVMLQDPELKPLVDCAEMTGWIGPGRHVMAYCLRNKKEYNLVMLHPDRGIQAGEAYDVPGSVEQMRADYAGWEPRVEKLLSLVSHTLIWPLLDRDPLDTWVHPTAPIALLGDACHPMLPYRAQGAAMAIEDSAYLGILFSHISSRRQIRPLLEAYQAQRYPRTTETQLAARANQKIFHLPDGPEQVARDISMREGMEDSLREARKGVSMSTLDPSRSVGNANVWADQRKNQIQFGYDAEAEATRWWNTQGYQLEAEELAFKL